MKENPIKWKIRIKNEPQVLQQRQHLPLIVSKVCQVILVEQGYSRSSLQTCLCLNTKRTRGKIQYLVLLRVAPKQSALSTTLGGRSQSQKQTTKKANTKTVPEVWLEFPKTQFHFKPYHTYKYDWVNALISPFAQMRKLRHAKIKKKKLNKVKPRPCSYTCSTEVSSLPLKVLSVYQMTHRGSPCIQLK